MYDVVVKKFTFAISSPDKFLYFIGIQTFSETERLVGKCASYSRWKWRTTNSELTGAKSVVAADTGRNVVILARFRDRLDVLCETDRNSK